MSQCYLASSYSELARYTSEAKYFVTFVEVDKIGTIGKTVVRVLSNMFNGTNKKKPFKVVLAKLEESFRNIQTSRFESYLPIQISPICYIVLYSANDYLTEDYQMSCCLTTKKQNKYYLPRTVEVKRYTGGVAVHHVDEEESFTERWRRAENFIRLCYNYDKRAFVQMDDEIHLLKPDQLFYQLVVGTFHLLEDEQELEKFRDEFDVKTAQDIVDSYYFERVMPTKKRNQHKKKVEEKRRKVQAKTEQQNEAFRVVASRNKKQNLNHKSLVRQNHLKKLQQQQQEDPSSKRSKHINRMTKSVNQKLRKFGVTNIVGGSDDYKLPPAPIPAPLPSRPSDLCTDIAIQRANKATTELHRWSLVSPPSETIEGLNTSSSSFYHHKSPVAILDRLNQSGRFVYNTNLVKPDCPFFKARLSNNYVNPYTTVPPKHQEQEDREKLVKKMTSTHHQLGRSRLQSQQQDIECDLEGVVYNRYFDIAFPASALNDINDKFSKNSFCFLKDVAFLNFTTNISRCPPQLAVDWLKHQGLVPPLLDILKFVNVNVKDESFRAIAGDAQISDYDISNWL